MLVAITNSAFATCCPKFVVHNCVGHRWRVALARQHRDQPPKCLLVIKTLHRAHSLANEPQRRIVLGLFVNGLDGSIGDLGSDSLAVQFLGECSWRQSLASLSALDPLSRESRIVDETDFGEPVQECNRNLGRNALLGQPICQLAARASLTRQRIKQDLSSNGLDVGGWTDCFGILMRRGSGTDPRLHP